MFCFFNSIYQHRFFLEFWNNSIQFNYCRVIQRHEMIETVVEIVKPYCRLIVKWNINHIVTLRISTPHICLSVSVRILVQLSLKSHSHESKILRQILEVDVLSVTLLICILIFLLLFPMYHLLRLNQLLSGLFTTV